MMKVAILLLAALQPPDGDLTGKWTIEGDVQGNAVSLSCVVQEKEATIAGTCEVNGMAAVNVAGDVKNTDFKFSFTVAGYTLTYTGSIQGDIVGGDIEVSGATGKFAGKRIKE